MKRILLRLLVGLMAALCVLAGLTGLTSGCGLVGDGTNAARDEPVTFGDYWYQGKAEITSYNLKQARYGELHDGDAVLIFVTEDFSAQKQVKLDRPEEAGDDAVKVLKLNALREFNTGVYPYTVMTSAFTPVYRDRHPRTLKITTSVQEWCGHAFVQLNLQDDRYRVHQYSYFESEGDRVADLENAIPEDEIWTTIRLNPDALPTGEVSMIPGTLYQRLDHTAWRTVNATAILMPDAREPEIMVYNLVYYPDLNRTLTIRFMRDFPHEIESWEEVEIAADGTTKELVTTAVRNKRIMLDYWTKNSVVDVGLRAELGLDE